MRGVGRWEVPPEGELATLRTLLDGRVVGGGKKREGLSKKSLSRNILFTSNRSLSTETANIELVQRVGF